MIFKHLSVPGEGETGFKALRTMVAEGMPANRASALLRPWDEFQQAWENGDGDRRGQRAPPGGSDD